MIIAEQVQYISTENQIRIAYTEHGKNNKETLLFIHGLANYLWVWKWNIDYLQQYYRCLAIDLPGNGYSSRGDYPYSISFFEEQVLGFIKAMGLKNVSLVGHSMGGQIALQLAINHGQAFRKLILCAPAGLEYYSPSDATLFKSAIAFGNLLALDETHIVQSINSSFYKTDKEAAEIIKDLNDIIQANDRIGYRNMLEKCIDSMLDNQIFDDLNKITNSSLILFGENDQLIPNRFLHPSSTKDIALKGAAQMQNANVVMYEETGHFVQIEQASNVNIAIAEFMGK